jgi:hypothetical protein
MTDQSNVPRVRHRPWGSCGTSGKCQCGAWFGESVHLSEEEQIERADRAITAAMRAVMDIGLTTAGSLDHPALDHLEAAERCLHSSGEMAASDEVRIEIAHRMESARIDAHATADAEQKSYWNGMADGYQDSYDLVTREKMTEWAGEKGLNDES